jgi:lipid II:glycine glycyltransferase (peptidoglycan interpeptide bridge formation enzyme)
MPEIVTITERDRDIWNEFVASHRFCHYAQSYEWGELRRAEGWNAIRLGVRSNGKITAGIALLQKKFPSIGKSILYAPRGPLIDSNDLEGVELLMEGIGDVARIEGAVFLRADPYEHDGNYAGVRSLLLRLGFLETGMDWSSWNLGRNLMIVDLPADCESLLASFNQRTRRNIRLCQKKGVVVSEDNSEQGLREFYELLKDTSKAKQLAFRDYHHFDTLRKQFGSIYSFRLFIARLDSNPVAGCLCVNFGKRLWYLYGGKNNNLPDVPAGQLIHWEIMKLAIKEGYEMYDLLGTACNYPPQPNDKGYGVYEFKQGLGGKLTRLIGYFDLVFEPLWYKVSVKTEKYIMPKVYANYAYYKNLSNWLKSKSLPLILWQ